MHHRIRDMILKDDLCIAVTFYDNTMKTYDMRVLIERMPIFKPLEDLNVFRSAVVDTGGYGIVWNDNLDLSCDELWENGKQL